MREVMQKAQELAEAILASDICSKMKDLEAKVQTDEAAASAMGKMIEKRQAVENILSSADMDPEELARASEEMEQAEQEMNGNPMICELREARKDFSTMMDNVNRILRLVITGEVQEDDPGSGGCGGDCSRCGGCR